MGFRFDTYLKVKCVLSEYRSVIRKNFKENVFKKQTVREALRSEPLADTTEMPPKFSDYDM